MERLIVRGIDTPLIHKKRGKENDTRNEIDKKRTEKN